MNFDFSKIRPYDQSQNNGFEELVCQLAHLEKIDGQKTFIRKEGAGGDAGIECYWKLVDDGEIGWQVKYFMDGMDSSKWGQITKSFKTALKKHPNLKKFIVSLPLDKTDSRKMGKGGKTVVSLEDEWNDHVKSWTEIAKAEGRSIEFEFWGKHEIVQRLTIDDPLYSGRALYWFEEPVLNSTTFKSVADRARVSLGDRYTPEFHVELPIAKSLDGLSLNEHWWLTLTDQLTELSKKADDFFNKFLNAKKEILDKEKVKELQSQVSKISQVLDEAIRRKQFVFRLDEIEQSVIDIAKFEDELYSYENDVFKGDDRANSVFRRFFSEFYSLNRFLESIPTKASKIKAALIYGDPGIGKSHLLCDLSLHRLEEGLPTVFLLGSHYRGGNPIDLIKNALDLQSYRNAQVLGALDAAGEACRSRAMIVIDAINEGGFREEWYDHIRAFIEELSGYDNICLLISCRTTYLKYILPDTIKDEILVRVHHRGFQGYEHRAAEKYLSQQGISKPSAPILAPEFTNPLFLKTCCQALKSSGATAFPKGLQGITSLFDFYLQSIEKTIARKKGYNPSEEIIKTCLTEIASRLFPDDLVGIPISDARKIINDHDPNPNKGDSLFDELLHEGIISEDISYKENDRGKPVIRFTYERFSDHFVAEQIIEQYTKDNVSDIFKPEQPLGKLIAERRYYSLEGIFEALAVLLAEKYKLELIDLLPDDTDLNNFALDQLFSQTVIWRSAESFTDRTLELLNSLRGYNHPALDILLVLSTEPDHPWNAELLHRNLVKKTMAERDHEWSIYIADKDFEEEDGESESIVRTLIEWSGFGDLRDIEPERVRLCAVTLIWFLTTSNRKVRDQSTKSLVRILTLYPDLLDGLIDKFCEVNDLYLLERLYAIAYGVVCNSKDTEFIKSIALKVYDLLFKDRVPIPHILLRDYARGILEFANHLSLLPSKIDPESFRPPYKSTWPLENPTEEEIEKLAGDRFKSKIRSSLMGFPGDFGNYSMSSIHNWSPTPITEPRPKTGRECKVEFAEAHLDGDLKERYLRIVAPPKQPEQEKDELEIDEEKIREEFEKMDTEALLELGNQYEKEEEEIEKDKETLWGEINASLDDKQKEYFRWVSGVWEDRSAAFSRKWAQRWVCKRAYSFGWTNELFDDFERTCSHGRGSGYGSHKERVGKKYQWIAYHEFLAHLADNVHWIDRGYSDLEDQKFYGSWQIHARDIDPTIWIRESGEQSYFNEKNVWWQKFKFPIDGITDLEDQKQFLWDEEALPDFAKLLTVSKSGSQNEWTVLRGFWNQHQKNDLDKDAPKLDAWFRLNSLVIAKKDYEKVAKALKTGALVDPDTVHVQSTQHQTFWGEYAWHPSIDHVSGWREPDSWSRNSIPVEYFVPISQYEWEQGSTDHSLNESISFYLPAKELIDELKLVHSQDDFGAWINKSNEVIFLDPSVKEKGASFALIRTDHLQKWLDQNDLEILWLIGGEKQLFSSGADNYYGRLTFNGLYRKEESKVSGDMWFVKEDPTKN